MVVRRSNIITFYIDSLPLVNTTNLGPETNIPSIDTDIRIGSFQGLSYDINGYIQDVTIVKGEAWDTHKFHDTTLDAKSSYLKAAWKFGDYSVYDCVGNNHLTNNGVTFTDTGLQGYKCANLEATNFQRLYRSVTSGDDLSAPDKMTISLWFNFESIADKSLFHQANVMFLEIINSNTVLPCIYQSNGTQIFNEPFPSYSFSTGIWYHFVMVADGSYLKLYINGSIVPSATTAYNGTLRQLSSTLGIGGNAAGTFTSDGLLAEIYFWKGVGLNASEISLLYNSGRAKLLELDSRRHSYRFYNDYLDSYSKYLVAGWNLDEMSGTRYDNVKFNHLKDVNSNVTYISDAIHGNVAVLNGTNGFFRRGIIDGTPMSKDVHPSNTVTRSIWVNFDSFKKAWVEGDNYLIHTSYWPDIDRGFLLDVFSNYIYVAFHQANGTYIEATIENTLLLNIWYNIIVVLDGTHMKIYLNGNQIGTDVDYISLYSNTSYNWNIGIGARNNDGAGPIHGKIANVQFYNIALDSTAITSLYNAGLGRKLLYSNTINKPYPDSTDTYGIIKNI